LTEGEKRTVQMKTKEKDWFPDRRLTQTNAQCAPGGPSMPPPAPALPASLHPPALLARAKPSRARCPVSRQTLARAGTFAAHVQPPSVDRPRRAPTPAARARPACSHPLVLTFGIIPRTRGGGWARVTLLWDGRPFPLPRAGRDAVTNLCQRSSSSLGRGAPRRRVPLPRWGVRGGAIQDCRAKRVGVLSEPPRVRSTWGLETRPATARSCFFATSLPDSPSTAPAGWEICLLNLFFPRVSRSKFLPLFACRKNICPGLCENGGPGERRRRRRREFNRKILERRRRRRISRGGAAGAWGRLSGTRQQVGRAFSGL